MKMEIDLRNEVDNEAIQNAIVKKIEELDLKNSFSISNKIEIQIKNEIEEFVRNKTKESFNCKYGSDLEYKFKDEVKIIMQGFIRELVNPVIEKFMAENEEYIKEYLLENYSQIFISKLQDAINGSISNYNYNQAAWSSATAVKNMKQGLRQY